MDKDLMQQLLDAYAHMKQGFQLAAETEKKGRYVGHPICMHVYNIERTVKEMRNDLIKISLGLYQEQVGKNVTLDPDKFIQAMDKERGPLEFDISVIEETIKPYIENKDVLAMTEMTENVRMLFPGRYVDGRWMKQVTHKKNVLSLEMHVDTKYNCIDHNYYAALSALEGLINITLDGAPPSAAGGSQLLYLYWNCRHDQGQLFDTHPLSPPFLTVKLYKNGRMDLTFRKTEDCNRVAAELNNIDHK